MAEQDSAKKPSWLDDKAPRQSQPEPDLFGGDIGKHTVTENLVNPNVPVRESAFVKLGRARNGNAESAGESAQPHALGLKSPGIHSTKPHTPGPAEAPAAKGRLAAPDEVQFGDLEVNEAKHERVYVFNQGDTTATLAAHLEGAPALTIVTKPDRLRPSREGLDPNAGIELSYRPIARAVDDSVLVVTLSWSDGTSETVRIKVRAAAHKRSEPTHAEQAAHDAETSRQLESQKQQDKIAAAHEKDIQKALKRPGGFQPPIELGFNRLMIAAQRFFSNQAVGVGAAEKKAKEYSKQQPPPSQPSIAVPLIKAALSLATGRLSTLLEAGVDALKPPEKFKQWEKGTAANMPSSVLGGLKSVLGFAISEGKTAIEAHLPSGIPAQDQDTGASAETRIDFFDKQQTALNEAIAERQNYLVDIKRALLPLNTPELAESAGLMLDGLAKLFRMKAEQAKEIQEYETTRQWARLLSHLSLGSVSAREAQQQGLRPMADGSPTANTKTALLASGTHGGLLDVEFSADIVHPEKPAAFTKARLFGLSKMSVKALKLNQLPLQTAGLPIRIRSSPASSPLAVTITRDEAGNVLFIDESGAAGMQTRWLSRRGGGHDDAAAYRAAKQLLDHVATKTLTELGVALETDDA